MIFDAFQRSCWDWALYNGSNANKGKKKNPAHQIFRKFTFILSLKEFGLLKLNRVYL